MNLKVKIRVAPSEPKSIKALGPSSTLPERFGVDILWKDGRGKLAGIQRKAFPEDFMASIKDGRLHKEFRQMMKIQKMGGLAGLILEGLPNWDKDGKLRHKYLKHSESRHESLLTSIQCRYGVKYWVTRDHQHTVDMVRKIVKWTHGDEISSLANRGSSVSSWGRSMRLEEQAFFLQGLPACGQVRARVLIDHFKGLPIGWTVSEDDLLGVPGVGKGIAKRWLAFMEMITKEATE